MADVAPDSLRGALLARFEPRLAHFARRASAPGRDPRELVIVLAHVDDPFGGALADVLMPGHDWQRYRDRGELPVALGLAMKAGVATAVERAFGKAWAAKLRDVPDGSVAVCVLAAGGVCTARIDLADVAPGGDA